MDRQVDGSAFFNVLITVFFDPTPEHDLDFAETLFLLSDALCSGLVLLHDDERFRLERAREPVITARRIQAKHGRRVRHGRSRVRRRFGDGMFGIVEREQVRVGSIDQRPRQRIEPGIAAVQTDCRRSEK